MRTLVGTLALLGATASIRLSIDPNITKACGNVSCTQRPSWTLAYCLATDLSSVGGTTCRNNAGGGPRTQNYQYTGSTCP